MPSTHPNINHAVITNNSTLTYIIFDAALLAWWCKRYIRKIGYQDKMHIFWGQIEICSCIGLMKRAQCLTVVCSIGTRIGLAENMEGSRMGNQWFPVLSSHMAWYGHNHTRCRWFKECRFRKIPSVSLLYIYTNWACIKQTGPILSSQVR